MTLPKRLETQKTTATFMYYDQKHQRAKPRTFSEMKIFLKRHAR